MTLPLLNPFVGIAVVLNVIYVFNSFPIIWVMTQGGPDNSTHILVTYLYELAFRLGRPAPAAAVSLVMLAIVFAFTALYVRLQARSDVTRARMLRKSACAGWCCRRCCVLVLFPFAVMLSTALKPPDEVLAYPPRWLPQHIELGQFRRDVAGGGFRLGDLPTAWASAAPRRRSPCGGVPAAYATGAGSDSRAAAASDVPAGDPDARRRSLLVLGLFRLVAAIRLVGRFNARWCSASTPPSTSPSRCGCCSLFRDHPARARGSGFLDGASGFQRIRWVFMPLAAPAVGITAVFVFIYCWNEFVLAMTLLRSNEKFTLTYQIFSLVGGSYRIEWDRVMGATLLASVPVAVVFSVLQRYLVSGLTVDSVK